jgi:hypothetical protein
MLHAASDGTARFYGFATFIEHRYGFLFLVFSQCSSLRSKGEEKVIVIPAEAGI